MFQQNNRSKRIDTYSSKHESKIYVMQRHQIVYMQLVFLLMAIIFAVSVFLYFISPKVFKTYPMYFPSILEDTQTDVEGAGQQSVSGNISSVSEKETHQYVTELRVIPREYAYSLRIWRKNISAITLFLNELLLGPRSIYLKNPIPSTIQVRQIMEGRGDNKNLVFIIFSLNESNATSKEENLPNRAQLKDLREWLQVNVDKYFDNYVVKLIVK